MAKCDVCGKGFYTKSRGKKYCSVECRAIAKRIKQRENEQLCWSCQNACGGCSWSKNLIPVVGWNATPILVKDEEGDIRTYKIVKCPQYKADWE